MSIRLFLVFSLIIFLGNCISVMRIEDRQTQSVIDVKAKKDEIFDRALIWISKRATDSNHSIKIKDKVEGRIIARLGILCKPSGGMMSNTSYAGRIDFNLDITAKDNKARIIFDDIIALQLAQGNRPEQPVGPEDKTDLENIDKTCLVPLKKELTAAIEGTAANTKKDDF